MGRNARLRKARRAPRGTPPKLPAPPAAWWRQPYHLAFIGVLVVAAAIRLYYFSLTRDQPLWWDEAEYMLKGRALAFGTPDTGWYSGRPILLPVLAAALFKIGLGEVTVRLLWIVLSTASLALVYRIGALLFDERIGLYAVALGSVFYLDLFYATRLLVDGAQVFFVVLAAYLVVSALHGGGGRPAAASVLAVLVAGTALRFTAGLFVAVVALFLLAVKGRALLTAWEWYLSVAVGLVVSLPLAIYFWSLYGNPLHFLLYQSVLRGARDFAGASATPGEIFLAYVRHFPIYTSWLVSAVVAGGLLQALVVIGQRRRQLRQDRAAQGYLLLLLWVLVPLLFLVFVVNHFEDRFLSIAFPAVFLLAGAALQTAYELVKKHTHPAVALAAVLAVLGYGGYEMAGRTHAIIADKTSSYAAIRDAGVWIKARTGTGDAVLSASVPQNTYYAERATYAFPGAEPEFEALLAARAPRYMVLSRWEQSPAWTYDWPQRNPERVSVAEVFFLDQARKQPIAIVYAFK